MMTRPQAWKEWTFVAALVLAPAASCIEATAILGEPPEIQFEGRSQELPLTQINDRFLVHARIGDAGPYAFLIDTGASISVLDTAIAADLELEVVGQLPVGAPGGNQVTSDRVWVPEMTVNGLTIRKLSPVAVELEAMSSGMIQGVLGVEVFRDVLLTLDPFRQVATISHDQLSPEAPGAIAFDDSQGRMLFDIDVAGQTVVTQIDTGSPSAFTVPAEAWQGLPTDVDTERKRTATLVGGQREVTVRRLDGVVSFAGLSYDRPNVAVMEPTLHTGNIGGEILNELIISIDNRNNLIAFSRPAAAAGAPLPVRRVRSDNGARRLGVQFGGGPGRSLADVGRVDPDSLGEQAGFKPGDTILSLNDKPMSDYDIAALGSTIRGDQRLSFVIERDGRKQRIEID